MDPKILLKQLTNKKYIYLTKSGNEAIKIILKILNKSITLIQDQGGWITYKQFPKKIVELKTDYGIVYVEELKNKANSDSLLLINSLPSYFAEQPMQEIYKICKQKNCLLINDVSGSIGTSLAKFGDLIVGSFGKHKPINLEYGGFIATDNKLNIIETFDNSKLNELIKKINNLPLRLKKLHNITNKVKKDLKEFDIIHKDHNGINVIVKYKNEEEKNKIIKYCNLNKLEYTLCPRYIKVNEEAISIEIKRK